MELGRTLIFIGLTIVVIGLVLMFLPGLGGGRLPGDISVKRGNFSFHFPVVTSIVLSILLTIVLNVLLRRK
jgi:hypothetical protein